MRTSGATPREEVCDPRALVRAGRLGRRGRLAVWGTWKKPPKVETAGQIESFLEKQRLPFLFDSLASLRLTVARFFVLLGFKQVPPKKYDFGGPPQPVAARRSGAAKTAPRGTSVIDRDRG